MGRNEKLDVLATFLRTSQQRSTGERVALACASLGGSPRISQVFDLLRMSEDEFAQAVGDAESRGWVRRERNNGQVMLALIASSRQLMEMGLQQQ